MSTAIEQPKTFEERVLGRIKDSIGDLVTDADLKAMVERGIETALFGPREISDRYGNKSRLPSLVDEAVQKFVAERASAAVDEYLKANPEAIDKAIRGAINDGIGKCLLGALDNRFSWVFQELAEKARQGLR